MSIARRAPAWIAGAALLAAGAGEPAPAQTPPAATAVDLGGLETRTAALMLSAQEAGGLELSVAAVALPDAVTAGAVTAGAGAAAGAAAAADRSRVLLVVDLAGAPEPAPEAGARGGGGLIAEGPLITEVYAYALDARGRLAATLTRAFRLDLEASREALAQGGVKFFGHLDLPPGEYSLRVLAQQRRMDRLGLEVLPLSVPSWAGGAPVLLPPLALEGAGRWLLVFEEGEPPPPFPRTIEGEPRVPATRWRMGAGEKSTYLLLGRDLGGGLRARLLGEASDEPLELGMGDLRAVDGGLAGLDAVTATLDATGLESGDYRVRVSSASGVEAASSLSVRPGEDPGLWADAESPSPTGRRRRVRNEGPRAGTERVTRVLDAYRKALGALEAQDRDALLRPLVELERREIGGGEAAEQKRLGEAELRAAWELAGGDAEGLLPLIWLHGELYRQYHAHGSYQLATHSRRVLSGLAEVYLERRPSAEARHFVACALAGVAGYLQGIGALPAAKEAWEAVLDAEPDHPAGLIGLATIRESYSDYEGAAHLLERLRGESSDSQVSLRLAVNLRRLGKDRRAEKLLRESLEAPGPEWVAAVAAQELASLLAEQERFDEAFAVLEAAITRHPGVPRLRVQMAALFDRTGRPDAARAALAELDPAAGRDAGSPRMRYSRMPTQALSEARRALAEEARRRLPRLLAAPDDGARAQLPAGGPRGGGR